MKKLREAAIKSVWFNPADPGSSGDLRVPGRVYVKQVIARSVLQAANLETPVHMRTSVADTGPIKISIHIRCSIGADLLLKRINVIYDFPGKGMLFEEGIYMDKTDNNNCTDSVTVIYT